MGKKDNSEARQYTNEFKLDAVKLAIAVGTSAAAKRLGVPDTSLYYWVSRHRDGKLGANQDKMPTDKKDVAELTAENARLR